MNEGKTIICGTGRAGTTFLMYILGYLNKPELNTGFTIKDLNTGVTINKDCLSGLEKAFTTDQVVSSPYNIIKHPGLLPHIEAIVKRINISHVIIPIRDYKECAESRERFKYSAGGLWQAHNKEDQLLFFYKIIAEYISVMTRYAIPTIFIDFYKMIKDKDYVYKCLLPVFNKHECKVDRMELYDAYDKAVNMREVAIKTKQQLSSSEI